MWQNSQFSRSPVRLVHFGTDSISYLSPKMWDIVPDDYKTIDNSNILKVRLRNGNYKIANVDYVKFTSIE